MQLGIQNSVLLFLKSGYFNPENPANPINHSKNQSSLLDNWGHFIDICSPFSEGLKLS
jgi:hypothetical protein